MQLNKDILPEEAEEMRRICARIVEAVDSRDLTSRQAAKFCGVGQDKLAKMRRGEYRNVTMLTIIRVAVTAGISVSHLTGEGAI